jgi:uncharacterized membrane protein
MEKEKLGLERLVFFSDAVIAIAITLLALDLRIDKIAGQPHFTASYIVSEWQKFLAFLLSFLLIALFWLNHHQFFQLIRKIDEPLVWNNVGWLLFLVLLPFSTTLVSADFGQTLTVLIYSLNILGITIFQNIIWDYAVNHHYLVENVEEALVNDYRLYCNVAMANSLIAIIVSFLSPTIAFFVLFTRPLMKNLADRVWRKDSQKRGKPGKRQKRSQKTIQED